MTATGMKQFWKQLFGAAALAVAPAAWGFSLQGPGGPDGNTPAKDWQLPAANGGWEIGYNNAGRIGSPMFAETGEGYRWNIPVIYYAFDSSFITYFGKDGMNAVREAVKILNRLPAVSRMSKDLSEFPLNTTQVNHEAAQLGLVDVKSMALQTLLEEIGLIDPVHWCFGIFNRTGPDDAGTYTVVGFNYDPVTYRKTPYVNGTLWSYEINENIPGRTADAQEIPGPVSDNEQANMPVAALFSLSGLPGFFYTGLTRDDVGGLRYLYRPGRVVVETNFPGSFPGVGGWVPFIGTNALTNVVATNLVTTNGFAIRGGIDKLRFQEVFFDSLIGQGFTAFTNQFSERVINTNGNWQTQTTRRPVTQPDIVFTARPLAPPGFLVDRTATTGWLNNDLLNGITVLGGPGTITGPIEIAFSSLFPYVQNTSPSFLREPNPSDPVARGAGLIGSIWASFDGTTNAPIIYPVGNGYTIRDIQNLGSGGTP